MWRKKGLWAGLLALPLAICGVVYGVNSVANQPRKAAADTCPLTGEELPCPNCCPLKAKN
jgi:hypothetical protein